MNFEHQYDNWLYQAFESGVPSNVTAFSFNLYEPALVSGVKFGIEVIGAGEFSPEDEDWACHEVWEPKQRQLFIPIAFSGENWGTCQERVKELTIRFLNSEKPYSKILKSKQGIGIGFIDGNLDIIWQP